MRSPRSEGADIRIEKVTYRTRLASFRALAVAFRSDPVLRWLQPRAWADPLFFAGTWLSLRKDLQIADVALSGQQVVGAAYWEKPGVRPSRVGELVATPLLLAALRTGTSRGEILAERLHEHRPCEPHWYLSTIGATLPHRGIGTALLRCGLARADGLVYLESSNSRNIPLYERYGFTSTGEVTLPGGPILYTMVRNSA